MAQRKRCGGQFKVRVAIEAITGHKTVNQISTEHGVHPTQVTKWKKQAVHQLPEVLAKGVTRVQASCSVTKDLKAQAASATNYPDIRGLVLGSGLG